MDRYNVAQLIGLARRLDPALTGEDFAYAGLRLDRMDDRAFAEIGLSQRDVAVLRDRFAAWPRDARIADQQLEPGNPAPHKPEPGTGDPPPGGRRQHQPGHEPTAQAERDDLEAEP